jgi:hypothetical protein
LGQTLDGGDRVHSIDHGIAAAIGVSGMIENGECGIGQNGHAHHEKPANHAMSCCYGSISAHDPPPRFMICHTPPAAPLLGI